MNDISTKKVILNDYAAFMLAVCGPVALAISIFMAVFGFIPEIGGKGGQIVEPAFAIAGCAVALLLTAVLFFFLFKRISRIKRILVSGPREQATVTAIGFMKDRGRVEFEYTYGGTAYEGGLAIMKNKRTEALSQGTTIEIALDPSDPTKALIVQLYAAD